MGKDGLNEEHVGDSVSNGLVDELGEGYEVVECGGLGRGGRFMGGELCLGFGREENGAVAVGFEVDANGVVLGGMVEMFDTGRDAPDRYALEGTNCEFVQTDVLLKDIPP